MKKNMNNVVDPQNNVTSQNATQNIHSTSLVYVQN